MPDEYKYTVAYIYPVETKKAFIPCTNCDIPYEGNFCPNCGEKRFTSHSLSLKHHAEETLEGLFHFDGKFFRTVKTLVAKPGMLSVDNVSGRTVRFVKAFQLFLIINFIVFLLPIMNPFSLPLHNYITYTPFTNYGTVKAVKKELIIKNTNYRMFEPKFDEEMHVTSKAYILLFIPVYALLFNVAFINKKRKFGEHIIFATHFMSFVLLAFMILPFLCSLILAAFNGKDTGGFSETFDSAIVVVLSVAMISYLFFAFRKFYQANIVQNIVGAVVMGAGFFYLLQVYRIFMFYKIIWFS